MATIEKTHCAALLIPRRFFVCDLKMHRSDKGASFQLSNQTKMYLSPRRNGKFDQSLSRRYSRAFLDDKTPRTVGLFPAAMKR
jgi:hypothetical protein